MRLAYAIYGLDATLIDIGGLNNRSSASQRQQYHESLRDLSQALTEAVNQSCGRALGIAWSFDGYSEGGVASTALLARLRTAVHQLAAEVTPRVPDTQVLVELNCLYKAASSLTWRQFRSLWESGYVSPDFSLRKAPRLAIDWGEDRFAFRAYMASDYAGSRLVSERVLRITVPAQPSFNARLRAARKGRYVTKFAMWMWPAKEHRRLSLSETAVEKLVESGGAWQTSRTPEITDLVQLLGQSESDPGTSNVHYGTWLAVLGSSLITMEDYYTETIFVRD